MTRFTRHLCTAASAVIAAAALAPTLQAGYVNGELYMLSRWLIDPNDPMAFREGLVRIDTQTGQPTTMIFPAGTLITDIGAYDPYRQRILTPKSNTEITAIASDGARSTITLTGWDPLHRMACTGDGRVYFTNFSGGLSYLDAANQPHHVMNAAGTQTYSIASYTTSTAFLIFDAASNSLIMVDSLAFNTTQAQRFTLSADGTRVIASAGPNPFDVAPGIEWPTGISAGPNGKVFVQIATNADGPAPRMLLLDPQTLQFSTFATPDYRYSRAVNAGTYSSAKGQALLLDGWIDMLRVYSSGDSGAGTLLGPALTGYGTANPAFLFSIGDSINNAVPPQPSCTGDVAPAGGPDHLVNVNDMLLVITNWGATGANPADADHNSVVNVSDLLAVITHWGACP